MLSELRNNEDEVLKIKIMSIVLGVINGGALSIVPLYFYDFLLSKNIDLQGGTDIALRGAIGAIFVIFIVNIIMLTIIYRLRSRASHKSHVFIFVFVAWATATAVLAVTLGRSHGLFSEGESGENLAAAFGVISSIINFISIVMAAIIGKIAAGGRAGTGTGHICREKDIREW